MHNILNLNKRTEERKLKEFKEKAQKAANEMDEICLKYELKVVPYIRMSVLGNSSLLNGLTAEYTFQPMSQTELEAIKLRKQHEAENSKLDSEKTS